MKKIGLGFLTDSGKNEYNYWPAVIGAIALMLLKKFDKASALSVTLAVVGLTALIYSIRHASTKRDYFSIAGITAVAFSVRFYGYIGDSNLDILLGLAVGLIMFALMAAERFLKKYDDKFWYTLIFPSLYILFMYFTETFKINMPFRMDTYLSCMPVICQITSVLGIYFLDFLVGFTASVLAFLLDHRVSKQSIILAIIYACVMLAVLCFGIIHMNRMNTNEQTKNDTVRIAYATGPYIGDFVEAESVDLTYDESMESLEDVVESAAKENAEILMLSEEAYGIRDADEDVFIENVKKLATENNMHLLLAYVTEDFDGSEDGRSINKLCWISNEGEVIYDYTKHCIIPFVETSEYVRGDKTIEPFEIDVHGKTLSVATAICYDSDFDIFMSHMGKGLDLLLLPTWDWKAVAEQHFSVARIRAIASETTIVRSVYDGWSAVIDSAGNILARDNTNDTGYASVLIYDVPIK